MCIVGGESSEERMGVEGEDVIGIVLGLHNRAYIA